MDRARMAGIAACRQVSFGTTVDGQLAASNGENAIEDTDTAGRDTTNQGYPSNRSVSLFESIRVRRRCGKPKAPDRTGVPGGPSGHDRRAAKNLFV